MSHPAETILATLPGSNDGERVIMVLKNRDEAGSRVEMRQQSWCEQFGWYTQNTLELEPQQVAALRNFLGQSSSDSPLDRRFARMNRTPGFQPKVVRADSA